VNPSADRLRGRVASVEEKEFVEFVFLGAFCGTTEVMP
jgi:hypothetical protein